MVGRWRTTRREAGRDTVEVLRYCGTAGEDVLDATSFISGCVRANWVISTRQEFLTIAKSLQLARTVVSVVAYTPVRRGVNCQCLHWRPHLKVHCLVTLEVHCLDEGLTTQKMFVHLPKIRKFYANYAKFTQITQIYAKYFCVRTPKF